jgi:hypothetical protein
MKTTERKWREWQVKLVQYAMAEAEHTVDLTAKFWRECFDDGMTPQQAFNESFVEQDGI